MPVKEILISHNQKLTRPTRRIYNLELTRTPPWPWLLTLQQFTKRLPDNILNDKGRSVKDTTSLFHFRFFLNRYFMGRCQTNNPPKKLLINLTQHIRRQRRELIGTLRIVQPLDDILQWFIINHQLRSQCIRRLREILLFLKVKQTGVVPLISLNKEITETPIDIRTRQQRPQPLILFNTSILTNTKNDNPVKCHLDALI